MPTSSPYTVIYSFGDSLSDAGDAYLLTTSPIASTYGLSPEPVSPPYYQATYTSSSGGSLTADVFSNGPVWVQDLATLLGIATPGPGTVGVGTPFGYQTVVDGAANGTDFAIGGSVTGVTDENSSAAVGLTDLSAQVVNFEQAVGAPSPTALYTVWSGSNDLLNLLSDSNFATLEANGTAASDVAASVNNELSAIQSLVADGAQSILVVNVPDLGAVPEVTAEGTAASMAATALAQSFDAQLAAGLSSDNFGTAHIVLEDAYGLINSAIASPQSFGLTNVTGSVYTGSFTSDSPPPTVMGDAQNQYLFFDMLHPTETGQMVVANQALTDLGVACYVKGTRIAVPGGETPVDCLAIGDELVTAAGGVESIRWIGQRSYAGRFLAANPHLHPIHFQAGSLGGGLPRRDLFVSPKHAMFLDGVLIPAECLVNGATITRETGLTMVEYFHIELAHHDVILAEGAPSETFIDDNSRGMFQNARDFSVLYPNEPEPLGYCAPRMESGYALERVRQRLAPIEIRSAQAA